MSEQFLDSNPQEAISQPDTSHSAPSGEQGLPSLAELEKMEKFKFDGQEWTAKDLKSAYMRQQDYSRKTQELAEQRKSFEETRKFYVNLNADLQFVKDNPQYAQKFLETYPQEFHSALRQVLGQQSGQTTTQQQQNRGPDVDLMSRITNLEKVYHNQEVAKNQAELESTVKEFEAKYPNAIPEMVIGRVFEAYNRMLEQDPNVKLTKQMWEDTFKSVDAMMKQRESDRYRSKQQEQLKANKRAGDVSAGGATVGRAPQKFKSLKDVTAYAERELSGRS